MMHGRWVPGDKIAHFTLGRYLGSGWEGHVFAAKDHRAGRICTLKIFRNRRDVAQSVRHTVRHWRRYAGIGGIKQVYDHGFEPSLGVFWIAADFVAGVTLATLVGQRKVREPIQYLLLLCAALEPMHKLGLSIGDFDRLRNVILEKHTGRLVFCDLDAGGPQEPPPSTQEDIEELYRAAILMWRAIGTQQEDMLLHGIKQCRTATDALKVLSCRPRAPPP